MNKKIITLILIVGIILVAGLLLWSLEKAESSEFSKQELLQKFQTLKTQYKQAKAEGYDVTETKAFVRQAKQAYNKGNYKKANEFLDEAFEALRKGGKPSPTLTPTPPTVGTDKEEAKKNLSQVKVASQYRRVTDGIAGRSEDDVIEILKATHTGFVYQGWMRQNPCPDACSDLSSDKRKNCEQQGYSYEYLRNAISKLKKEMPDVIFGGGFLAEFLEPNSWNEVTGETYTRDRLWEMAADPSKWGIPKSKNNFQTEFAIRLGWIKQGQPYNPKEQMQYYFPDITNPDVKELFLSWAKKQIDSGVDSIWIDGLYGQAELLKELTGDINHKAVKESYEASSNIIDEIHTYGLSKGRYIYVISWVRPMMFEAPYPAPDFDGVMVTIGTQEISGMKMDEKKWDGYKGKIKEKFGDVPIFARIDYGNVGSPLAVFSQELTKEQANQFLKIADEFFQRKGIIFIYPIHGGNMGGIGQKGKILSYGKYDWYDSLAPEFETYETIKELAQKKAEGSN